MLGEGRGKDGRMKGERVVILSIVMLLTQALCWLKMAEIQVHTTYTVTRPGHKPWVVPCHSVKQVDGLSYAKLEKTIGDGFRKLLFQEKLT